MGLVCSKDTLRGKEKKLGIFANRDFCKNCVTGSTPGHSSSLSAQPSLLHFWLKLLKSVGISSTFQNLQLLSGPHLTTGGSPSNNSPSSTISVFAPPKPSLSQAVSTLTPMLCLPVLSEDSFHLSFLISSLVFTLPCRPRVHFLSWTAAPAGPAAYRIIPAHISRVIKTNALFLGKLLFLQFPSPLSVASPTQTPEKQANATPQLAPFCICHIY